MGGSRALVGALLFLLTSFAARAQTVVEWEARFEEGLAAARAANRPVLIDFSADWCPPCKQMDEKVWPDPDLVSILKNRVVAVRIDFDQERKLAGRFGITGIPTMIWADPWGNELGRNLGFTDVPTLLTAIGSLPDDFRPIASFQVLASESEAPAVPLVRIASFYRAKGLLLAADSFYKKGLEASKKGQKEPQAAEQAYVGLGWNCLAREQADEARKLFEKATKLPAGPNRANALHGLVAAHAKLGDKKKATARLEELRTAYPDFVSLSAAEALVSSIKEP